MTVHEVLVNSKPHRVRVLERNGGVFSVEIDKKSVRVRLKNAGIGKIGMMEINGNTFQANVEKMRTDVFLVKIGEKRFEVEFPTKIIKEHAVELEPVAAVVKKPSAGLLVEKDAVPAPIAGRIVLWKAEAGRKVDKGECICILEAMKMENEVAAPRAGVVKEIRVSAGAVVNKGDVLAVID